MPNRLLTPDEAAREMLADANRIADEYGLTGEDRARFLCAVFSNIGNTPMGESDRENATHG